MIHAELIGPGRVARTYDYGPYYNKLDDRGVPILGELLAPNQNALGHIAEAAEFDFDAIAPEPGIVAVASVVGKANGDISVNAIQMDDRPALITVADIDVMMALVFSDVEPPRDMQKTGTRPVPFESPQLGMPHEDKIRLRGRLITLAGRVFTPKWAAATAVASTFYVVDRHLGEFAVNALNIAEADRMPHPRLPAIAQEFRDTLREFVRSSTSVVSQFCWIIPQQQPPIDDTNRAGDIQIVPLQIDPVVMSWVTPGRQPVPWTELNTNPTKYRVNEPGTLHGDIANNLSNNFNELAALIPVFERYRQLVMLYEALRHLKHTGFQPNEAMRRRIHQTIATCATNHALARANNPEYDSVVFHNFPIPK